MEITINDFIKRLKNISKEKKKLPFIIIAPNGTECVPRIKMKFKNYGNPLLGDKLEAMVITWED